MELVKKRDVISHLIDTFYHKVEEKGICLYLRYTNLHRPDARTLEIPDEIEIKAKNAREEEEKEEN